MNEHLRPAASVHLSPDVRIRHEGKVELLEDSLALFDSVDAALRREEQSADDAGTLSEAENQLPRIADALASLGQRPEDGTAELLALVRAHQARVLDALTTRLGAAPPSLLEGLVLARDDIRRRRSPPARGDTRFRKSRIRSELAFLVGGVLSGLYVAVILALSDNGRYPHFWWCGVFIIVAVVLLSRASTRWELLADGFYAKGVWWPLSQVQLKSATRKSSVAVRFAGTEVEDDSLYALVELMRSPLLTGLARQPRAVVAQTRAHWTLQSPEGALHVKREEVELVADALGGKGARDEDVFAVLSHVSVGRWAPLAEFLVSRDLATWAPSPTRATPESKPPASPTS